MKNKIPKALSLLSIFLLLPNIAKADWEATLKSAFPSAVVEVFDNDNDWHGTCAGDTGIGNYWGYGVGPKRTDGSNSPWTFYSCWNASQATTPWIGTFGAGTSVGNTGKSLKLDTTNVVGPSRMGIYFGPGSNYNAGFSDLYVFERVKFNQNGFPTDGTDTSTSYTEGNAFTYYWAYNKLAAFNMGCAGPNGETQCAAGQSPYSPLHVIPHIMSYSYAPYNHQLALKVEINEVAPAGGGAGMTETYGLDNGGKVVPRNAWIGIEWHAHNSTIGGVKTCTVEVWLYDAAGVATQIETAATGPFNIQPVNTLWNFIWLGGNESYTVGPTINNYYYVDDVIINGSRIGPTYYSLLGAPSDTTAPAPPTGLSLR